MDRVDREFLAVGISFGLYMAIVGGGYVLWQYGTGVLVEYAITVMVAILFVAGCVVSIIFGLWAEANLPGRIRQWRGGE